MRVLYLLQYLLCPRIQSDSAGYSSSLSSLSSISSLLFTSLTTRCTSITSSVSSLQSVDNFNLPYSPLPLFFSFSFYLFFSFLLVLLHPITLLHPSLPSLSVVRQEEQRYIFCNTPCTHDRGTSVSDGIEWMGKGVEGRREGWRVVLLIPPLFPPCCVPISICLLDSMPLTCLE